MNRRPVRGMFIVEKDRELPRQREGDIGEVHLHLETWFVEGYLLGHLAPRRREEVIYMNGAGD